MEEKNQLLENSTDKQETDNDKASVDNIEKSDYEYLKELNNRLILFKIENDKDKPSYSNRR